MALPSTLHHLDLHLANVDRGAERELTLRIARHPSESMDRLWLRVLAFAWQHEEGLAFGPGLCEPDVPDLLAAGPDGRPTLLVRVGKPDPERVARDVAQGGGARVAALFESPRKLDAFLDSTGTQAFLVTEMSAGQMLDDVLKAVKGRVPLEYYGRMGGMVPFPDEILGEIQRISHEPLTVTDDPRQGWMKRFASIVEAEKSRN